MSTKVYEGLKIKAKDLDRFLKWFNEVCGKRITGNLRRLAKDAKVTDEEIRNYKGGKLNKKNLVRAMKLRKACTAYVYLGETFLPCWANFWIYKDSFLINPMFPVQLENRGKYSINRKVTLPDFVKEYGYWNNSDMPEGMSLREWRNREEAWHHVLYETPERKLSYVLVEYTRERGYPSMTWYSKFSDLVALSDDEKRLEFGCWISSGIFDADDKAREDHDAKQSMEKTSKGKKKAKVEKSG